MKRDEFIKKCTACGAFSLIALTIPENLLIANPLYANEKLSTEINRDQILKFISYLDCEMDESVRQKIFCKLGYECFYCTNADNWIKNMNLSSLIETINNGKSSRWEKIEYNPEQSVLKITGRKAPCSCTFAQEQQKPKSLCNYCRKSFFQEFFGTLLNKNVKAVIDETVILGGERCCATIFIS